MKLRNKKTRMIGEVGYLITDLATGDGKIVVSNIYNQDELYEYDSLAKLNAEWEDYEELKEYWYYDTTKNGVDKISHLEDKEKDQAIGNYFETKEEAEKAVEKLKAWKRLKDNGFEFRRWEIIDGTINFMILPKGDYREKVYEDLDICFGGEE